MRRRQLLYFACFLAAFHPNCQRCCPTDSYGGCTCRWAWEQCPARMDSCGTSSSSTKLFDAPGNVDGSADFSPTPVLDASAHAQSQNATLQGLETIGATCAFVGNDLVTSVPETSTVRVLHVESTAWDEDPFTVRDVGSLIFQGEEPGRVVAGKDVAYVALRRGGAVAAIDAKSASLVRRIDDAIGRRRTWP